MISRECFELYFECSGKVRRSDGSVKGSRRDTIAAMKPGKSAEPQTATLAEIAREAGVSAPTVSKVLNGRADVAPATRSRVEELLHAYGYRRRRAEASRSPLIDLVFHELESAWAMEVIRGVENVARDAGLSVVLSESAGRLTPGRTWADQVAARRPHGVVLVLSGLDGSQRALLNSRSIPFVVMDPAGDPGVDVPSIGATNWQGGLAATRHLVELGHTRIGAISGPSRMMCSRARVDGYRAAMGAAGFPVPTGYVRYGDFMSVTGYQETMALLDLPEPPTAIFVCSDQMALGAYEALYERGMRVPDDMSIVGFDDLDEARWAIPPLTTVRQPLTEMAGVATRMLFNLIAGEELDSDRVELSTPLVLRASTRALS